MFNLIEQKQKKMLSLIEQIGVPKRVAKQMLDEYLSSQQKEPALSFRDLLQMAKRWKKNPLHRRSINTNITPVRQLGSLCKAVAIATIEAYYAKEIGYEPIHLWSRQQPIFSIRKLVKENGSVQGEILEFKQWEKSLYDLGFDIETVNFNNNIMLFVKTIVHGLHAGCLLLIAFAVVRKLGVPDPNPSSPHDTEHAAVITGYHPKTDEVVFSHWGRSYTVDLEMLFRSSSALPETRCQELYNKNSAYTHDKKDEIKKYIHVSLVNGEADLKSIIPIEKSGFNAKLIVIKKPEKSLLLQQRASRLSQMVFFNTKKNVDLVILPSPRTLMRGETQLT